MKTKEEKLAKKLINIMLKQGMNKKQMLQTLAVARERYNELIQIMPNVNCDNHLYDEYYKKTKRTPPPAPSPIGRGC